MKKKKLQQTNSNSQGGDDDNESLFCVRTHGERSGYLWNVSTCLALRISGKSMELFAVNLIRDGEQNDKNKIGGFGTYCFINIVLAHALYCLLLCVISRRPCRHAFFWLRVAREWWRSWRERRERKLRFIENKTKKLRNKELKGVSLKVM